MEDYWHENRIPSDDDNTNHVSDQQEYHNELNYEENYPPLPPSPTIQERVGPHHRASPKHQTMQEIRTFLQNPENHDPDNFSQPPENPNRRRVETAPTQQQPGRRVQVPPRRPPPAPGPRPPTLRIVESQVTADPRRLGPRTVDASSDNPIPQTQQPTPPAPVLKTKKPLPPHHNTKRHRLHQLVGLPTCQPATTFS